MNRHLNHDKRPLDTSVVNSEPFDHVVDILCGEASLVSPEAVAAEIINYFGGVE